MTSIFRVQDAEGRGPFRPGFTKFWIENRDKLDSLPPWPLEFGCTILESRKPGEHAGCGCRSLYQITLWFTPVELASLVGFGYHLVKMEVDKILAESKIQLVFLRSKPLRDSVNIIV